VTIPDPVVSDNYDSAPVVTNDAPAVFPLGCTTVTFTATDASGNSAGDSIQVHNAANHDGTGRCNG
jgi:hypothetical protein